MEVLCFEAEEDEQEEEEEEEEEIGIKIKRDCLIFHWAKFEQLSWKVVLLKFYR